MKTFLIICLVTIIISYLIHYIVGFILKSWLKKDNKFEIYNKFDKSEKEKRPFKETLKIKFFYFLPFFNVMITIIEIVNINSTYKKLIDALKVFEAKENKEK